MRYEPAMKYGLLVGIVSAALAWGLGVQLTEEQLGAIAVLLPLVQGLLQGCLTRRKVTPVAKLQDQGMRIPS
jgi:hypothetical protein